MSQSSNVEDGEIQADGKVILLQRGRELSEFVAVLTELDAATLICESGLPSREEIGTAKLVIATAERLLESGPPHLSQWPRTLVVVQKPAKTLTAHLGRIGATMILHRPIHPRALRLLLLHELYHGLEKRGRERTLIGQLVRIGSGLFRSKVMLVDLSPSSARLHLAKEPKLASTLSIYLGRELTQAAPLKLKARVVRCNPLRGEPGYEVGLSLLAQRSDRIVLRSILDRFASGPGRWESNGAGAGQSAPESVRGGKPSEARPKMRPKTTQKTVHQAAQKATPQVEQEKAPPAPKSLPPARPAPGSDSPNLRALRADSWGEEESLESDVRKVETQPAEPPERRSQQRIPYDTRVVALDEEAARVLLGRDLSIEGMRIVSNATVPMGSRLRIALHSGTDMESLVLMTRAVRDDGSDGMMLAFENLDSIQREQLEKIIAWGGSIHESTDPESAQAGADDFIVVGELLEEIELDDEVGDASSFFDAGESIEDTL